MRVLIIGNTNNHGMIMARSLINLGHRVNLALLSLEMLHRPDPNDSYLKNSALQIHDLGNFGEWESAKCRDICGLLELDAIDFSFAILNATGPSFRSQIPLPCLSYLTGSDLTELTSWKRPWQLIRTQKVSLSSIFRAPIILLLLMNLVRRQRSGIRKSEIVSGPPKGSSRLDVKLLQDLHVKTNQLMSLRFAEFPLIKEEAKERNTDGPITVTMTARIDFDRTIRPGLSDFDYKGSDIAIKGFTQFLLEGGSGLLRIPRKGRDIDLLEKLIDSLNIRDSIEWYSAPTRTRFHEIILNSDIVIDQLSKAQTNGSAVEAMLCGRPVIANFKPSEWSLAVGSEPPGFQAENVSEVCNALHLASNNRLDLEDIGTAGKQWADSFSDIKRVMPEIINRIHGSSKNGTIPTNKTSNQAN